MPIPCVCLLLLGWVEPGDHVARLPPLESPLVEAAPSAWPDQASVPAQFPGSPIPDHSNPALSEDPATSALLPGTQLRGTWITGGGRRGFGIAEFDINYTAYLGYNDLPPLTIAPGFGMHLWSGPTSLPLPPRVYDLYLDLQWRPIERETWGLSCGITPGFYGDFERFDHNTFQLTGWVMADVMLNENWKVAAGLAYVRQLESHLLPVGGLIWSPNDDMRLELVIPKPRFTHRYRTTELGSHWWYVGGQLGGGSWAVADTSTSNALVGYSDLRLSLGTEFLGVRGNWWSAEIGYVFARQITVDQYAAFEPADALLLQGSILY